jgi:hypothetical protein
VTDKGTNLSSFENMNHTISSGILFFSAPPNSTNIYFLLGMDNNNERWSDFGGCKHAAESDEGCAAREMMEETLGLVCVSPQCLDYFRWSDNPSDITNATNDCSDELCLPTIFQTSYQQIITEQLRQRQFACRICIDVAHPNHLKPPQSDWSAAADTDTSAVLNNPLPPKHRVCYLKKIPWQPNLPRLFITTVKYLNRLAKLSSAKQRVMYFETGLPKKLWHHPALLKYYEVDEDGDHLVDVCVHGQWLEKQQMAWWSIPRLKNVIRSGGKYKNVRFRHGVLSTLSVAIEQIRAMYNSKKTVQTNPNNSKVELLNTTITTIDSQTTTAFKTVLADDLPSITAHMPCHLLCHIKSVGLGRQC